MKTDEEIYRTIEQLEDLLRQLKTAVQERSVRKPPLPALCQESVSAIPDWP